MPMHDRRHTCPHDACDVEIGREMFACRRHWFVLPASLRARIWTAYRAGDVGETLQCYREAHAEWRDR